MTAQINTPALRERFIATFVDAVVATETTPWDQGIMYSAVGARFDFVAFDEGLAGDDTDLVIDQNWRQLLPELQHVSIAQPTTARDLRDEVQRILSTATSIDQLIDYTIRNALNR